MANDALISANTPPIGVLLVEDNPGDVSLLREALAEAGENRFELAHAEHLTQALERLEEGRFNLILLDLSLPDSAGLETFARAYEQAQGVAIIILTGTDDETMAAQALRMGAQDYLVKGQLSNDLLVRSMRAAIERKKAQEERERLIHELQASLGKVKALNDLLRICVSCKRVCVNSGDWSEIEVFLSEHAGAECSNCLCPVCVQRLHPAVERNAPTTDQARVLFIEDNPGDVRLIRESLRDVKNAPFILECVDRLSAGLERLAQNDIDLVLTDLTLPDSARLDTFFRIHELKPDVPIIVLTGIEEDVLGVEAMQAGAQDYLVKGKMDGDRLVRAMRYAIERQRLKVELRDLSLVDDLTGLKNRRGFINLAEQQLKLTQTVRATGGMLFLADINGLKQINDTYGHQEGSRAIAKIAAVLKETFRNSDVIARYGGDEFVVFAIETAEYSAEDFLARLEKNLQSSRAQAGLPYKLSVSVGVAHVKPRTATTLDELIAQADAAMYEQKRSGKRQSGGLRSE